MTQTQPFYLQSPGLHILCLLGALTTWGLCIADGTVSHLLVVLHGPSEYVLPGSSATLRSTFTHIFPVDYLLRMLVIFFWEPAYGRLPATSATGVYFLGQVFPIMTAVCLDGVRGGSSRAPKSRLLTPMMWLFLFQMTGMATTGGLWVLSFVNTSPTTSTTASLSTLRQASLVSRSTGLIVLVAMVLGYAVPGVAMGLHSPTFVSSDFQQWAIAAWNVYPIWVFLFVKAGELVASKVFPEPSHAQRSGNKGEVVANPSRQNHLKAVRLVSAATLITGFAVHIAVFF
ncbi:hypothetical protein KJ359_010604 [Pestalotiopsis sp. 9143b]|nr:hypothetical protein KJ359_010604 [Pestalotiopsis sp. 9143b]